MRYVLLLCAALSMVTGAPDVPGEARCSLAIVPGTRMSTTTVLLATGTRDTVVAGPGNTVSMGYPGHSGTGAPGLVHGQLFDVARFGGADSLRLARAFAERGDERVVIVPWDYDAACMPTRWTRRTAWVSPGEPGTFTVDLRPDSLWVDGIPVLDAFAAEFEPYPLSPFYADTLRRFPPTARGLRLEAAELFELLLNVPPRDVIAQRPDSIWAEFSRWVEANPELTDRYPGNEAIGAVASSVRGVKYSRVLRAIDPVPAGTWRMTLSLDAFPERGFYMRTHPRVMSEWRDEKVLPEPWDPAAEPERPDGYMLAVSTALSLDDLPANCIRRVGTGSAIEHLVDSNGYMYVIDPPPHAGHAEWAGWLEMNLLTHPFRADSAFIRFGRQAFDEWAARRRAGGTAREATAHLWLDGDTMRVEQTIRLSDGRELRVRGERISRTTVPCER